jgi:hypothetical protein
MPGRRTVRLLLLVPCALLAAACGDAATSYSSAPAGSSQAGNSAPQQLPAGRDASSQAQAAPAAPGGVAPGAAVPAPAPIAGTGSAGSSDRAARGTTASGPGASGVPVNLGIAQGRVERSVSARYVVPHDGFLDAFDRVVNRATSLGGFVVESSTTPDSTGRISSGAVTVRVPSARLSDLLSGLPSDVFTVSSLNYGSQDHTAETVDLNARVAASIAHRAALEGLRDRTRSIAEIASLEQQIAQVQLEVDQQQGALNAVNNRVDLATASIALAEKDAKPAAAPVNHSEPALLRALRTGADNALQLIAGGVLVAVTALPVAVLALAAWLGRRRLRRLLSVRPPSA